MNQIKLVAMFTVFTGLLACGISEKKVEDKRTTESKGEAQAVKDKKLLLSSYLQDVEIRGSTSVLPGECSGTYPQPLEPKEDQGCYPCEGENFSTNQNQNDCYYCPGSSEAGAAEGDEIQVGGINNEDANTSIFIDESNEVDLPVAIDDSVNEVGEVDLPVAIDDIGAEDSRCDEDNIVAFESTLSSDDLDSKKAIFRCVKNDIEVPEQKEKPIFHHPEEPTTCGVYDHRDLALCGLDSGNFKVLDLTHKEFKKSRELCVYLGCDLIPDFYATGVFHSEAKKDASISIKHKKISASWQCYQMNPYEKVNVNDGAPMPVGTEEVATYRK